MADSHAGHDRAAAAPPAPAPLAISLDGLGCGDCAAEAVARLAEQPAVRAVKIDGPGRVAYLTLAGPADAAELAALARSACGCASPTPLPASGVSAHHHAHAVSLPADGAAGGMVGTGAAAQGGAHAGHDMSDPRMAAAMEGAMRRRFWLALALGLPVVLYSPMTMMLTGWHPPTPFGLPADWLLLAFSTPVALWLSAVFHQGAWRALRSRRLDMSVLVSLGILVSYFFSLGLTLFAPGQETFYEAAVMLAVFLLFGHWMEMRARRGSSDAVRSLLALAPRQATVERDGRQLELPAEAVVVGDVVVLKPGDKVPVDGEILDGETTVDESMVTGESLPVAKGPGAAVVAGTINQSGSVRYRATKVGADTALAQIVALVERAQSSRAPAQRLADRAAELLVLLAVGTGLVTFLAWLVLGGATPLVALTFAVTAVVIACPDALGLATPTAVMVATDLGAKRGLLFKEAVSLEQAARIQAVILDKTGTLTEGRPRVTDLVAAPGFAEDEVLRLAAAAEARSGHPLAAAILAEAEGRGLEVSAAVGDFESIAGHGLKARVAGRAVLAGNERLLAREGLALGALAAAAERLRAEGKTLILVAVDGAAAGLLALADPVRPTARQAVAGLQALGIEVIMMTGDNRATAEAVARAVGIDQVRAEVLPADKAAEVARLQAAGKVVAMVGDGVNDAPALAQADLGIAIGAGTDVAVEAGDIVLMHSDPADVLAAIRLSRLTVRKMRQNLFWAAIYNVVAIPLAAGLLYPATGILLRPEVGALAMSASSITVVSNALLLRRARL